MIVSWDVRLRKSPIFSSRLGKIHYTPYVLFQLVTLKSTVFKRGSFSSSSMGDVDLGIWKSEMWSFSSIRDTEINHLPSLLCWSMVHAGCVEDRLPSGLLGASGITGTTLPNSQTLCSLWHACLSLICFLRFPQRTFTKKGPSKGSSSNGYWHEEDLHKDVAPEHINFPFPEVWAYQPNFWVVYHNSVLAWASGSVKWHVNIVAYRYAYV